jgi:hypothetical protein
MDTSPTEDRALSGLRVIDFSIMLAGPYCARLLADLGADVIKIEPPEGDDMRLRQPLRADETGGRHSSYFGQLNAGKRSLTLDLKNPEAIALIRRMVLDADVLLENFRPGVMDRLGLGAETCARAEPEAGVRLDIGLWTDRCGRRARGLRDDRAGRQRLRTHAGALRRRPQRARPPPPPSSPTCWAASSPFRPSRRRWCSARAPASASRSTWR